MQHAPALQHWQQQPSVIPGPIENVAKWSTNSKSFACAEILCPLNAYLRWKQGSTFHMAPHKCTDVLLAPVLLLLLLHATIIPKRSPAAAANITLGTLTVVH